MTSPRRTAVAALLAPSVVRALRVVSRRTVGIGLVCISLTAACAGSQGVGEPYAGWDEREFFDPSCPNDEAPNAPPLDVKKLQALDNETRARAELCRRVAEPERAVETLVVFGQTGCVRAIRFAAPAPPEELARCCRCLPSRTHAPVARGSPPSGVPVSGEPMSAGTGGRICQIYPETIVDRP